MKQEDQQETLFENERERKIVFFLVAFGVFTITYGILFVVDFLPEKPTEDDNTEEAAVVEIVEEVAIEEAVVVDPHPVKVIFDSLDREVVVLNPDSRDISALDQALLSGVVRHPDSADFQEEGTMFLFGHSSYLPNVFNKNFQAFNDIQELTWGDTVRVQSSDTEYVYRVDRVYQVKASDAEVTIERGEPKLTLATCNSFGSKDDRYIVEATLVSSQQIDG